MYSADISNARAALMAKFSPDAVARKRELLEQIRSLTLESLDLALGEFERLRLEGKDVAEAAAAFAVVRQQIVTADLGDTIAVAVIEQIMLAVDDRIAEAKRDFSDQVRERRNQLQERLRTVGAEDLDITLQEIRRLGMESSGSEAMLYHEVAAVLGMVRQQLESQGLEDPDMASPIGAVLKVARGIAQDEVQTRSRAN